MHVFKRVRTFGKRILKYALTISTNIRSKETQNISYILKTLNDKNMIPNYSREFAPLVRHDTGVTLTYDEQYQQYNSMKEEPKKTKHVSSESFDLESLRTQESNKNESKEGILFFPGIKNEAYCVKPISNVVLQGYLMKAMGKSKTNGEASVFKPDKDSIYKKRFVATFDTIVSKIFLAGFFWQSAAILCGYSIETFEFAVTTGLGDAFGVFVGHCFYDIFKKIVVDEGIDLTNTLQIGIFLSTASFFSGTVWQPIVNALQTAGFSFLGVFVCTWICCTYSFNFGLRIGRNLYSQRLLHVERPTWENSRTDFALSMAVGGGSAFFVGTDTTYLPEVNFLYYVVGIHDYTPQLVAAVAAGSSCVLGFGLTQSAFNVLYPIGECWID